MRDVLPDIERWRAAGERVALATVVSVVGSAPRGLGATLAVSEGGEVSGSVSGGCVEPAVIEDGLRAIRTGKPRLLTFGITEEQNVEQIGLSCGGEIRVFVERLESSPLTETLLQSLQAEMPVALATVIAAPDGNGELVGKHLLVSETANEPTLDEPGVAGLAAGVVERARDLLRRGETTGQTAIIPAHNATGNAQPGDDYEVFYAVYPAPPTLIIVGAGHISIPLTKLAKVLGYRVIVIDARETFATRERFPDADELLVEWPDEALERLPITGTTAVAVLTHDDKFDVPALAKALHSPAGYVGVIGSRGTRAARDKRLREEGITEEELAHIHGPIGLSIGAKTPEEIALAILAQIVAVRRGAETKS
jgi:xanthine dehydrogenase accessory factor